MARRGKVWYDRDGTGHFQIDGRDVTQAEYDAAFPSKFHQLLEGGNSVPGVPHSAGWPMTSLALSCHPDQVQAMTDRNKRHGVAGVSYAADGTCTIADPGAQAALHRLEKVHHNNKASGPGI